MPRWFIVVSYVALWSGRAGAVLASAGAALSVQTEPWWVTATFFAATVTLIIASTRPERVIKDWRAGKYEEA